METWFIIIFSVCITAILKPLFFNRNNHHNKLPPGPSFFKSNLLLLTNSLPALEPILQNLKSKHGPLITLKIGSRPSVFVGDHSLAHELLIHKGAIFSDRPRTNFKVRNISSASYGPTWRLLRRNLASEILHPSRVKSYSWARNWVLRVLITRLRKQELHEVHGVVKVYDHFQYAMFCLLVLMCFGEKFDESRINEIANCQRRFLLAIGSGRFNVLGVFPKLGKFLFRNRWKELLELRDLQENTLLPLIKSRIESGKCELGDENENEKIVAYVDTLVNIRINEEDGAKLTHKDMVNMCSEFLNAGTDTTSTALQWIMANLVKNPEIQRKLYEEIVSVVGPASGEVEGTFINEEDLHKMVYLKAVVLEGLRRHPPGHFVLPHRVMKDVEVKGYVIPEGATVNFMVGEMGLDPKVWEDPMEFKPERFMVNEGVFDISGSKGIKMMPFGAGRRVCPGLDLALLHLEYFVANLIWYFDWSVADGYDVDLSEKIEFTTVMKNPLQAKITSRAKKLTTSY
ncbi:cytochrome P450 89A2-like [Rutidosis leptorrhynchoides]|uniref:cytochrome P450 89A2-like n=1 Tax=Rutidosis leptorrhynchoides TaxID=125765 RepID=UPI003A99E4D5